MHLLLDSMILHCCNLPETTKKAVDAVTVFSGISISRREKAFRKILYPFLEQNITTAITTKRPSRAQIPAKIHLQYSKIKRKYCRAIKAG